MPKKDAQQEEVEIIISELVVEEERVIRVGNISKQFKQLVSGPIASDEDETLF